MIKGCAFIASRRKEGARLLTEETLRETVGEELFAQGRALFYRVPIREARRSRAETVYLVAGEEKHLVAVTARSSRCDCGRHPCPHAVAALLAALESGAQQEMEKHLLEHHGFLWHAGKTVFYGVCQDCQRK